MSARATYHVFLYVLWPIGGALIAAGTFLVSLWFAYLLFVWAVVVKVRLNAVVCPACGKPVNTLGQTGAGYFARMSRRFYIDMACDHCGGALY